MSVPIPIYQQAILRAFFEVTQPQLQRIRIKLEDGLIEFAATFLAGLPRILSVLFLTVLVLFNFLPILYLGRPTTLIRLALAERERLIHRWENSRFVPIREFIRVIKVLTMAGFYENPEVMRAIDYDPDPWIALVTKRRLESYPELAVEASRKELHDVEETSMKGNPSSSISSTKDRSTDDRSIGR